MLVKVMGMPWRRQDGTLVPPGRTFTPTEVEVRRMLRLNQFKRFHLHVIEDAGWPLRTSPRDYLRRYPEGKHADLARRLTGGT
jgi:N-acetyl-beta-hexosaminidase